MQAIQCEKGCKEGITQDKFLVWNLAQNSDGTTNEDLYNSASLGERTYKYTENSLPVQWDRKIIVEGVMGPNDD